MAQAKSSTQPHDQQGKETMHHHRGRGALGKAQEMPGVLALFENLILNDTAPVIGVENAERIAHLPIGQIDRSSAFGDAILPATHDYGIDGLADEIAAMSVLGVLDLSIAIVTGQG